MIKYHRQRPGRKRTKRSIVLLILLAAVSGGVFVLRGTLLTKVMKVQKKTAQYTSSSSAVSVSKTVASSSAKKGSAASSLQLAKPAAKHIISVARLSSKNRLPSGCELTGAMMLVNYFGHPTTADEIARRTPKSTLLRDGNNVYGMSPNQAFIGDPHLKDGLGCYAPVVTAVVDSYFWEGGKDKAVNLTGTALKTLAQNYIAKDFPVLIWATEDMREPSPGRSWILADTNQPFQWISGEHCLLMVGYDTDKYYFDDPNDSAKIKSYDKSLVEKRYRTLGKQAVAVCPVSASQT